MKILRVFCNEKGKFGNPVGIVTDINRKIPPKKRQQIAKESGLSEIVFINNPESKDISIFSPLREIPFAGHALVGVAYLFMVQDKTNTVKIKSMDNLIRAWHRNGLTWVEGNLSILPDWNYEQFKTPQEIEGLKTSESKNKKHTLVWSWIDKEKGVIRARTFASDWGIPEDEANGSGVMKLTATLKRKITVHHGKGSIIYANPINSQYVEVGGLVKKKFLT